MNAADVLDFWFGDAVAPRPEWFRKDEAFDASIRDRFGAAIEAALGGGLRDWDVAPEGRAGARDRARPVHAQRLRGTPRAFAGDALALQAAQAMVARGDDARLSPLRRVFAYLPFEHTEDMDMQRESMRLMAALGDANYDDYARRHAAVVERFGRFPHRNAILGRESTPEEIEFLEQPGSSF